MKITTTPNETAITDHEAFGGHLMTADPCDEAKKLRKEREKYVSEPDIGPNGRFVRPIILDQQAYDRLTKQIEAKEDDCDRQRAAAPAPRELTPAEKAAAKKKEEEEKKQMRMDLYEYRLENGL
mgnify:CR=1 FL=1